MVSWSQDLSRKQGCFSKRNKNWRTPSNRKESGPAYSWNLLEVPQRAFDGDVWDVWLTTSVSKPLRNWRLPIARCLKQETSHYIYNSHPCRTHQHPISSSAAGSSLRAIPYISTLPKHMSFCCFFPPFPPPSSTQKKAVWSLPQEFWVHHSASVLWINWQDSNSRFELPPSPYCHQRNHGQRGIDFRVGISITMLCEERALKLWSTELSRTGTNTEKI